VTDRDDALRRELGWAGPEESDDEPETGRPGAAEPSPPADSLAPRRPPVDFVPPEPQKRWSAHTRGRAPAVLHRSVSVVAGAAATTSAT
jgi:hypothetical protein